MPEYMNGIWYLSLMTIGVGFIAGSGWHCIHHWRFRRLLVRIAVYSP